VGVGLQVPCFRYCGKDLLAQLAIEPGDGADLLIKCPVRQGLYFLTPEERVRQALLWFLLVGARNAGEWRGRLRFEVEQRSIDVAAFIAADPPDDRFVFNVPVFIVETKRLEQELRGDMEIEKQLKTYMIRERCRDGFIFNACEGAWLSLRGDFTHGCWTKCHFSDLREMEERLQQATEVAKMAAMSYKNACTLAASGDFDSLLRLVSLVGVNSRLTFTLSIRLKGNLSAVRAFGIQRTDADNVSYRARGIVSRNRQHLTRGEFHSLLTVRPL
jgi:hypothetical protein